MHHKFVIRLHHIFMDKVHKEGKDAAKRWLSDTLQKYEDFVQVREYTYKVLGLSQLKQGV